MMMNGARPAGFTVQPGRTTPEDLADFAREGGAGQVIGESNADGSFTLYVLPEKGGGAGAFAAWDPLRRLAALDKGRQAVEQLFASWASGPHRDDEQPVALDELSRRLQTYRDDKAGGRLTPESPTPSSGSEGREGSELSEEFEILEMPDTPRRSGSPAGSGSVSRESAPDGAGLSSGAARTDSKSAASVTLEAPACGRMQDFLAAAVEGDRRETGGVTGSYALRVRGPAGEVLTFQIKPPVAHADLLRRAKADGLDAENLGEFVAGCVARALWGVTDPELVADLSIRQDDAAHELYVVSRWIPGGLGTLDDRARAQGLKFDRHVHVDLGFTVSEAKSGCTFVTLPEQARHDLCQHLVDRIVLGDLDMNAANFLLVERPARAKDGKEVQGAGTQLRVAAYDFGKAFHSLIMRKVAGKFAPGGGGVLDPAGNRILDAINRETVCGKPWARSTMVSKLWRDFTGLIPSAEFARALRARAVSSEAADAVRIGVAQAKASLHTLVMGLQKEDSAAARAQIAHQLRSLARICEDIGHRVTVDPDQPLQCVDAMMKRMEDFLLPGEELLYAADLCELQSEIDGHLRAGTGALPAAIQARYEALVARYEAQRKAHGRPAFRTPGLVWLKCARDKPAFQGNLADYVKLRRVQITEADLASRTHQARYPAHNLATTRPVTVSIDRADARR